VISNKHFHALLNYNKVLRSMTVCRFAIKMSLINHFHSERSISIDDECAWENEDGVEHDVSPTIHKL
jgi:hypothetical protein